MTTALSGYDVIVAGIGGMGSATAYHLARRGRKVLGLERFDVPHDLGSSHGITRIIRLAYYEHPSYVPLLRRAYELWRELETLADERLLHLTGSLDAGPPDSDVVQGSLRSCQLHDLPHELLTSAEITRRYPGYRLPGGHVAVLQPEGGFLLPERCIVHHVWAAQALGAEVHARERVHPDQLQREPTSRDEAVLRTFAERYFPDGAGPTMALKTCLFTNSPDEHFVVDLHPQYPQVVVASPCSGHGFKFASVMGEILADLATGGQTRHDISLFRLARFKR